LGGGGLKGRQRFEIQAQGGRLAELEGRNELKWLRTECTGGLFRTKQPNFKEIMEMTCISLWL